MDAKTQEKLIHSLLKSLVEIRETKGSVRIEDLGRVMDRLAAAIQAPSGESTQFLRREFQKIADQIGKAREEILALIPATEESKENISHASNQLDAVVRMTEEASNEIMDAAETIQQAVDTDADDMKETVSNAVAKIFMACNFQDITGQRIHKVMTTLEFVDEKISNIMELFAKMEQQPAEGENAGGDGAAATSHEKEKAQGLLNGPALPDKASTQDEIDALFSDL